MNVLSIFLTIGLPAIDESLDKLLVAMETFPNVAVLGDAVGLARIIGLLLALCAGSYERSEERRVGKECISRWWGGGE